MNRRSFLARLAGTTSVFVFGSGLWKPGTKSLAVVAPARLIPSPHIPAWVLLEQQLLKNELIRKGAVPESVKVGWHRSPTHHAYVVHAGGTAGPMHNLGIWTTVGANAPEKQDPYDWERRLVDMTAPTFRLAGKEVTPWVSEKDWADSTSPYPPQFVARKA